MRDVLARGTALTVAGRSTHQGVRDEWQCVSVLCVTQGIQGRGNRYMLMMHLAVHHLEVLLPLLKFLPPPDTESGKGQILLYFEQLHTAVP